jgi:geranylgeranyl reductase family protein
MKKQKERTVKMPKNITIIGAGPAGSYLAYLLAEKGFGVSVIEEHKEIGLPVQCTGILSKEFLKIFPKLDKEYLINKISKVRLFSRHKSVVLPINDIVIDRHRFDKYLFKKAEKSGAKFHLESRYLGFKDSCAFISDKSDKIKKIKADILVGADGPLSETAKSNNLFGKRKFYTGFQARIRGNFKKDTYEVYLGSICPDFFAWLVPESNTIARIGIASKTDIKEKFDNFLKIKQIKPSQIIDRQAGLIPIFDQKQQISQGSQVFLIGDAACQVKATTGGGIIPGLKAAEILAGCIINKKDYRKSLKKLDKELRLHLAIRKMLDRFNDRDYDRLLAMLGSRHADNILKRYSRDSPIRLVLNLIFAQPRLLLYLKKLL